MRALIVDYGVETVWAVVLVVLFLTTPARAQVGEGAWHFEPSIDDCPEDPWGCFRGGVS
jgi:hypothetical protein